MNFVFNLGWKEFAVIGGSVAGIILVTKLDSEAAERVSIKVIDAIKDYALAISER